MNYIFISFVVIQVICMVFHIYWLNKLRNVNSVLLYDIGKWRVTKKRLKLIRDRCENEFEIKIVDQLIVCSQISKFVAIAFFVLIFIQCCIWFIEAWKWHFSNLAQRKREVCEVDVGIRGRRVFLTLLENETIYFWLRQNLCELGNANMSSISKKTLR